ncbi:MAG: GNAT family N-acetyltransferase [Candidatus Sericytochromatia bacterium]|nr:GNAT family N-acetyltransferase [Candidatus Tanganyikabacteria bacterium]
MSADPATVPVAVRRHHESDRPHLLRFLEMAMLETYPDLRALPRSELRERVEAEFAHYFALPDKEIWVAEAQGGQVAGCLWAMASYHPVTGRRDLFIVNVAVAPEFRGLGLARRLFGLAVDAASAAHIPYVRLFVNPANQAAYRLYEELGFAAQTHEMRLEVPGPASDPRK